QSKLYSITKKIIRISLKEFDSHMVVSVKIWIEFKCGRYKKIDEYDSEVGVLLYVAPEVYWDR
ncbi:15296_t:CDS:1, partial [Dentiscutata heterogama]